MRGAGISAPSESQTSLGAEHGTLRRALPTAPHSRAMLSSQSRRLAFVAFLSTVLLVLATSRAPQGLYSDPAWQLLATEQFFAGNSPSINTLVQPDPSDVTRDRGEWIVWWAPGTQLAVSPLLAAGISPAAAVRAVVVICLLVGATGWALWFSLFRIPSWAQLALAALFPWARYASNALFFYSAEALVFGIAPWLLLGSLVEARRLAARPRAAVAPAAALGLALGMAYVLKYSAVFVSLGVLAFLALCVLGTVRGAREIRSAVEHYTSLRWRVAALAVCGIAFALPIGTLSALNRMQGSTANLVTASAGLHAHWHNIAFAIANPALAMADADAVARFLFLHPTRALLGSELSLVWFGLPGGLVLACLLAGSVRHIARATLTSGTSDPARSAESLAITVLLVSVCCLVLVWTISAGASFEARHVATASMAVLPLALQAGFARFRSSRLATRALLVGAASCYVGLPLAYGVASVAGKVGRLGAPYRVGPSGFASPVLASSDVRACLREATAGFDTRTDIWYLPEPISALDIGASRAIVVDADMTPIDKLRGHRFVTSVNRRVRALLPPSFEADGKGPLIRSSFPQARGWRDRAAPSCNYVVWDATLDAGPSLTAARP